MAIVPSTDTVTAVTTIQTNLINLYRVLQAQTVPATVNMASCAQAYTAINGMLSSMITNGMT